MYEYPIARQLMYMNSLANTLRDGPLEEEDPYYAQLRLGLMLHRDRGADVRLAEIVGCEPGTSVADCLYWLRRRGRDWGVRYSGPASMSVDILRSYFASEDLLLVGEVEMFNSQSDIVRVFPAEKFFEEVALYARGSIGHPVFIDSTNAWALESKGIEGYAFCRRQERV